MDIPTRHKDHPHNTPDQHGLEAGDHVDDGWGTTEVVEVGEHGVRFANGSEAAHHVVAINMTETDAQVA